MLAVPTRPPSIGKQPGIFRAVGLSDAFRIPDCSPMPFSVIHSCRPWKVMAASIAHATRTPRASPFLGNARADEDDDMPPDRIFRPGGVHGRSSGETMGARWRNQVGVILLDEIDDDRAGRSDDRPCVPVLLHVLPVGQGHDLRPEGRFFGRMKARGSSGPFSIWRETLAYRRRPGQKGRRMRRPCRPSAMAVHDVRPGASDALCAFWGQTRTQVPQTMQSSGTTWAWPSFTRMALTSQLRTQR